MAGVRPPTWQRRARSGADMSGHHRVLDRITSRSDSSLLGGPPARPAPPASALDALGLIVAALAAATRFAAIGILPPSIKSKPFAHATGEHR